MAVEVNLPVRLTIQNLQEVINGLQNKLSTLKIGSAGFKEMQNLVSALQRNLDQLQVQTSKPFINQNQFNQAGRSITQLEDKLKQVQNVISRVKFDDLQLSPSQLDSVKEFESQIQQIKNSIRDVKDSAKKDFLASEGGAAWLGFSPKNAIAVNQTLSQITASINSAFKQQTEAIEQAQQKLDQYKASLSLQDKITNFTNDMSKATSMQDLSKVFGDMYQQIFTASGEFQSGSETILSKWISTQFQIDEGTISGLIQNSASKVIESLKNGELQALISSKLSTLRTSTAGTTTGQLEADLEAKTAKLRELQPALDGITTANEGVSASEKTLRTQVQGLVDELEKLKQQYVDAARTGKTFTNDTKNGQTQLNSFRQMLAQTNTQFLQLERTQRNFNTMKMTITNFMGFYQVLNLVKRGVREALNHIQELDTVMNKISIVTNMSTGDLWNQVDAYSIMAQRYGTSIKGAYEVSQIYYQQGLETSEVLTLTNETLKLAKISGLDYAATTDYMTTALRGFKMEASDAARVVDVYSNLAAHTAVSQEELAVAMSKTASSLESVGATFEEGSAMIGTMVAVTRESATNIGSALKSIAARYGEMKSDPLKLVDAEGDVLAYNKVDAALQSVGITLKTTDGQFRNFTDVIIELGEKWNELDSTQQRYIATQFAGNRQQSRFLALVSNIDLLKANLEYAEDSEDTGSLQALKALDSIETKTEQVRVAYQQMYTTIGAEDIWKGVLDGLKNFMDTLNHLPKLFGKVPIGAIAMITDTVNVIKTIGFRALSGISRIWDVILPQETLAAKGAQAGQGFIQSVIDAINKDSDKVKGVGQETSNKIAEGAAQARQDLNQPAGKKKTTEEVREPAIQAGENAVRQAEALSQASGSAAQNIAAIANNMGRAANEAERATNALTTGSATPTAINTPIETVAQINLEDLKAKIQEQAQSIGLNDIELQARLTLADDLGPDILGKLQDAINSADFSTPEGLAQFTESLASIKNAADAAGVDIAAAFRNAGDMGIAGLVQGLASDGSAVSLAGSIGQEVIAALKAGMGVASPSVPAHDAAQFVMIGAANGLSDSMNLATAKATEAGTSIIEAIRQALEQSPLDLKSMIQFIPPDFDFEKADLSTLDSLKEQIQEKLESIKAMIADETQGQEYAKAANSILSPLLTKIDDTANAEVKAYDKQLKNSSEYRAKLEADKEAKEINDRIEYQNSIIERSQYGYRYHTQLQNQLLASQYHKYRWQDATSEEQDAIRKSVRTRLADEAKEAEAKLAELNPLREKALEKQAEAQAAFEPLLSQRNAMVAQIRANQQAAKDSITATFQGAKRVHLNDTLSAAAAPTLARIDAAREPLVEAERQRQEQEAAERQRQEQEAAAERQRQEAVERQRQEQEAAERQRQEAIERQRQEYEATQRQRQEEAERQRQEYEATQRQRQEEAERQRQEQEAAERRYQEEVERRRQEREAEERQRQEASEKLRQEQEANTVEYQRKAEFAIARSKAFAGDAYVPKNPSREWILRSIEGVESEKKFLREVGFSDASLGKMTPEEHNRAYHNAGSYVRELSKLESIKMKDAQQMLATRIQSTPDGEKQLMGNHWLAELYRKQEQQRQEQEAERQRQAQGANTVEPQRKAESSQQAAEITPKPTETSPAVIPKQEVEVVPKPAEGAATEAGNTIREQVQEAVDQKPVEVTPQQNTAEPTASAIKNDSDIKAIQEKITAVEQLKTATNELANTQKAAQEYQDALTARREAAANARNFEGLENIKYNTSQKTIDAQIESSKGELEAAQNQQAVANAIRDRIAALEQLKTAQDAVNNTTKGTIEYENAMAERRAAAAEVRKFEGLKNVSATTSQEVLNKEIAKSQAQLEAIPQTNIEAIKAKIEVLEQLKAAQEAVNNTEKVGAEQVAQKAQAQKDAIKEARAITGLGGIRAGISSSKIDEIIVKLKVQLDEATAKSAAVQAAEETKAEVENNPVQAQVTSDPATAEAAGAEAGAAFKQSAEANGQAEIPAPDISNVVEANNAAAESAEQAAEREKAAASEKAPASNTATPPASNTTTPSQIMDGGGAPVDTTATRAEIDSLIEKLVELKVMGKASAQELQSELDNMTPSQLQAKLEELRAKVEETGNAFQNFAHKANSIQLSGIGSAVRMFANLSGLSQQAKGGVMALGGAITLLGVLLKQVDKTTKSMAASNPWMAIAMGVMGLVNGISLIWENAAERLERLNKESEELANKSKQAKSDYRNLKSSTSKLDELSEKRYESAEAAKEYQTAVDDLASSFPELITGFDAAGNAIIDLQAAEQKLTAARQEAARAAIEAAQKEKEARAEKFKQTVQEKRGKIPTYTLFSSDASTPVSQQQYAIGDTSNYENSDFAAIVEIVGQMQQWDKDTIEFFSSGGTRGRYTTLWKDANGINPAGYYDRDGKYLGDYSSDIFWNYILSGERKEGFNLPGEESSLGGGFRNFFAKAAVGGLGNLGIDENKLSPNALQYLFSRKNNPTLLTRDKGIFTGVMNEFNSLAPDIYEFGVKSLITNDKGKEWAPFASLIRRSSLEAYPNPNLDDKEFITQYFGVDLNETPIDKQWIPDLINKIRTKQGNEDADAVKQYLTGEDKQGNRYFGQPGAWNYQGNNTGFGAIQSLISNVLQAAENGDMYNLDFFYKPLEALIKYYGGQDFLKKNPELQGAYTAVNEIVQMSREFYAQNRSSDATIVSEAVNLLASNNPDNHNYDFITNAPQLANLLYGDILNLEKKDEIIGATPQMAPTKVAEIAGDLITRYSDLYTDLGGKITEDGEELTKVFETMLANPSKYSSKDIISFLEKYGVTVDETIAKSLRQKWESSSQYYEGLLQKNLDNKTEKYKDSAAFTRLSNYLTGNADEAGLFSTREMTQTETNYFSRIMGYTATLSDKGYSDLADQYMESAINLFTGLSHEDVEIRNGIYAAIAKNNINTREGLDKIIKEAKKLGASDDVITQFETMRDYMITNLKLTIDASTEAFLDEWKDSSSTLKKITSGIDFSEVQSMIDQVESWGDVFVNDKKFELKLSDFVPDGDKLALTNEKAIEYWEAYSSQQREQADSWQETFTEARRGLSGSETGKVSEGTIQALNLDSQQTLQWLDTVLPGGYSQYIEEIKNPNGTVTRKIREGQLEAFVKAINDGMDATQSGIDTYYAYLDYAGAQIIKTTQWAEGNFSSIHSIYEKAGKFSDLSPEDRNKAVDNRLKAIAAGAKMTDWEYSQPDIKNAAKQIQTATGQYITDLVSKDISTLYAQDYVDTGRGKDTIAAEMAKAQDMTALAFAQWIGGLAQQAGQTIEEQNDSFMKAWDKKHKKNTLDGFNGVQFLEGGVFQATDSQFKEFANTYELKLADLVESGLAYYNEQLGTWVVDYVAIDQQFDTIDFNAIPGFKETVADGVNSFFTSLGDLIQKALQGAISNVEAKQLQEYAERLGFKGQLSFMPTGKGLKLNTQSIFDLYSIIPSGTPQGAEIASYFKDYLIESDDRLKSVSTTEASIAEVTRRQRGARIAQAGGKVAAFDQLNGNVDMYNRPRIDMGNGDYATVLSSTLDSRNFESDIPWVMNITPIPPDASTVEDMLSDADLDDYIQGILDQHPVSGQAILDMDKVENGGKGLIIDLKEVDEVTEEIVESEAEGAEILHEYSEIYESIKDGEKFNSAKIEQYEKELALLKEIQLTRSTSEDNSFKFMEGAIPAAQNNPLNYYENWGKAWKAIQTAGKEGYMSYQDFYNIATEMNNIAGISGQKIELAGITLDGKMESAAALIDKGAQSLAVTADGSIKVDLSKMGVDFASGADGMAENVDTGIKAMAQSQIDMLDGLIALMETIVAMESLKDIDADGMGIDLTDIFQITYDENGAIDTIDGFTEAYGKWREKIKAQITEGSEEYNEDLAKTMSSIMIDGNSLADMIQWDFTDFNPQQAQAFTSTMAALYQAAISNNYNLNNIADSVKETLIASGVNNLVVDIGDSSLVIAGGQVTAINWKDDDSQAVMERIRKEVDKHKKSTDTELHSYITGLMQDYSNGKELTTSELEYVLQMNHHLKVENGVTIIEWNGNTYKEGGKDFQAAMAAWRLKDSGVELDRDLTDEEKELGTITTTATVGEKTDVEVTSDGLTTTWKGQDGKDYSSKIAMLEGEWKTAKDNGDPKLEFEEWLWAQSVYHIRTAVQTQVIDEKTGKPIDTNTNNRVRQQVKEIMNMSHEELKKRLHEDGKGNYYIQLDNGIKVMLNGDDIQLDVNNPPDGATLAEQLAPILNIDQALADTITLGIKNAFGENGIPLESLKIVPTTTTVEGAIEVEPIETATGTLKNLKVKAENTEAEGTITNAQISAMLENASISVSINKEDAVTSLQEIEEAAKNVDAIDPEINVKELEKPTSITDRLRQIATQVSNLPNKTVTVSLGGTTDFNTGIDQLIDKVKELAKVWTVTFKANKTGNWPSVSGNNLPYATGTVGNAMASGGTLMGELGPELVVQKGRYFVAGQDGAEFVNLAPDAIVFNHLQTEQLLKNGMSSERGRAVTNERVAAAYAHGNMDGGPAMASASAALAALKQLRSMWQSLLGASVKDLAGAGGGGGGGGGGDSKDPDYGNFVKELEKWYNWLQKIAELEEEINYQESLRSKIQSDMIPHGENIAQSYLTSLKALQEEAAVHESLRDAQQKYFDSRRKWMNSTANPFSALYTFDENGQLKYKSGQLARLSNMVGSSEEGRANMGAQEQYDMLVSMGYGAFLKYDSEGKEIDFSLNDEGNLNDENAYVTAVQAFWDKIDADKEEMQSLHDSINEHRDAILESQEAMNEILQEIEDNQIAVEEKVLKAIEDSRQRAIDDAKDEKEAIEEASNNLIDGLSDQLEKERDMYTNQQNADELAKLQRQLAILQRSGGSATQIANLQSQISDKMQSAYFDAQQEQIDALKEATDAQLEKLDAQIELMEEQLAYEKEHGLLWSAVYEVMQGSPAAIANFIRENDSNLWGESPAQSAQSIRETLFEAQQYVEFRDAVVGGLDALINKLTDVSGDTVAAKGNPKTGSKTYKDTSLPTFDEGGMIDKTGVALVHAKEGVLTEEQTRILRRDILGHGANSLVNMLLDFKDAYNGIGASAGMIQTSEPVIIEHAEVSMNVQQIANDYDAQRAGEQAFEKIMQIAKKTKGWNRIGR